MLETAAAAMTRLHTSMLAVSLVVFASLMQQSSARSLLQTGGTTCSGPIPQCEAGRCYLQTVAGKMQNVCQRCRPGYNATADGLNCVCKPGFWHDCSSNPCTCKPCDKGMFCEGGWNQAKNYAAEDLKGLRRSCEQAAVVNPTSTTITTASIQKNGLTTKTDRAARPQDCVPMPGFYLATTSRTTQKAALCPVSTYSTGYGRVRQCLRCQSGTEENPDAGYANAITADPKLRINRLEVCQVPKGRYLVQNVVRDCPAGSFRTSYSLTTESSSRYCFTCPPGVTTNGTRATSPTDCNVVVAGVALNYGDLTNAQSLAATGDAGLGDTPVNLCPYGTYFPGGVLDATTKTTCVPCPFGTETQFVGATSESDCQIPPGYYIKITSAAGATDVTGVMEACPTNVSGQGFYRSGWTLHSDAKARDTDGTTACTPCGAGITSALTDVDESRGGNDTSRLVAGSSYSCFIQAGWGMVPTGVILPDNTLEYSAVLCANNTYGVATITYGLQSTPCKPCQRNLITLQEGSTNYTQCVNPAGFGYSPNGATACPPGSYAPVGSMQGCVQCPAGRTTDADSTKQIAVTDCYVSPGNGIFVGGTPTPPGPWDPDTNEMNDTTKAQLPVLPCPVGYYGPGGALDSRCKACDLGTSTSGEGSSTADACNKCAAGYGLPESASECQLCPAGTYQPGYLGNDVTTTPAFGGGMMCIPCETTRSVYISSKGTETEYISDGTTYRVGARGREECVPKTAQLGIDIGTKFFDDTSLLELVKDSPDPSACMDSHCKADQCCFVQFDYAYNKNNGNAGTKTCLHVNMGINTNAAAHTDKTSNLLFYKMLPSDAIAAASLSKIEGKVDAKAMSSGLYARCDLPKDWAATDAYNTDKIGRQIDSSGAPCDSKGCPRPAGTAAGLADCKKKCDMMSICWGFTVKGSECQLRGGFDEQDVRSFFRNPEKFTDLNW